MKWVASVRFNTVKDFDCGRWMGGIVQMNLRDSGRVLLSMVKRGMSVKLASPKEERRDTLGLGLSGACTVGTSVLYFIRHRANRITRLDAADTLHFETYPDGLLRWVSIHIRGPLLYELTQR